MQSLDLVTLQSLWPNLTAREVFWDGLRNTLILKLWFGTRGILRKCVGTFQSQARFVTIQNLIRIFQPNEIRCCPLLLPKMVCLGHGAFI